MNIDIKQIRNFCIIAHIDHGKSTLADRFLETTNTLTKREQRDQVLDAMDLERERGITIKAHPIRMIYHAQDRQEYILNLIDTPGHVDFSYEVSRSLSACEAAVLLVDASQGVEAQTLSNIYLALKCNLEIIPVINKIDLPNADVQRSVRQLKSLLGIEEEDILLASAKTGQGVEPILEAVVKKCPSPIKPDQSQAQLLDAPLQALIFDSLFDNYKGVVIYVRIVNGKACRGMRIRNMATNKVFDITEVGTFKLKIFPKEELFAGEVGYITANIKSAEDILIGDTITEDKNPTSCALPGFSVIRPMVYCGLYPLSLDQFENLRKAIQKLQLNDASFTAEPEDSVALGFGFRCGFLGLLHMEIMQERLEREFGIPLIATAPSVVYKIIKKSGEIVLVDNPSR
ncbi:MAG: translation elongation factor 4, partial [Chlamydiota bacterium]|nr:translation elongation factor 4 [Chlamydiota bacterium]